MSSVICQGLHSLDTQTTDTNTTLRLKLSLPFQETNKNNHSNPNLGVWNALQSLTPSCQTPKQKDTCAQPILSEKSLELCTENLGSETGSETDFSMEFPTMGEPNSLLEKECWTTSQGVKLPRKDTVGRKAKFPPPLTTLSGSGSVRVQAHREDGRLILEAVGGPLESSTGTNFRAERSNGRLKLCFWEEDCDSDEILGFQENQESEVYVEGNGEEEEEEDEASEDMSGNDMDVEGEMGMEEFERPRWCKVSGGCGNRSLTNWEPFWVATS